MTVSIGNITVGGTGKTPAACMLAQWGRNEGYRVAVLSRGYGGSHKSGALEVSDGYHMNATPAEAGDEACLLARKLPGVPVIVSRRRSVGGRRAVERFGSNFFVLDDGFQHLALKRDLNLVLIDAMCPFGNGHLLPRGPLREPLCQLKRADAFVVSRFAYGEAGEEIIGRLRRRYPEKPCFAGDHIPDQVVFPGKGEVYPPEFLNGKRTVAFAGIARPDAFRDMLSRVGAQAVLFRTFADHHLFEPDEIQDLLVQKERLGADWLLTTEKDWVRLRRPFSRHPDLGYLSVRFSIVSDEDGFFRMVGDVIRNAGGD
jgi:tetraacyldisaccharide 4'-kinase